MDVAVAHTPIIKQEISPETFQATKQNTTQMNYVCTLRKRRRKTSDRTTKRTRERKCSQNINLCVAVNSYELYPLFFYINIHFHFIVLTHLLAAAAAAAVFLSLFAQKIQLRFPIFRLLISSRNVYIYYSMYAERLELM